MTTLSGPQQQLLHDARNLALITDRMGQTDHGVLVSGHRYRTALALEAKGLGSVRYQGPSLGWFTKLPRAGGVS